MLHLLSIVTLLLKIRHTKSCRGVSLKTQELYALVFITRYIDLFYSYVSLYNTFMKIVFLTSSFAIIFYMRIHKVVKQTRDQNDDTLRVLFILVLCLVPAIIWPRKRTIAETLWTFSIYLESVAILPQLILLQRTQNIDNLTGNYVALLGSYRAFYILNWIYKYFTLLNYREWRVWLSGVLQTVIYLDFFYYYIKSWRNNEKLHLPA